MPGFPERPDPDPRYLSNRPVADQERLETSTDWSLSRHRLSGGFSLLRAQGL
jgi:hypothetical protein